MARKTVYLSGPIMDEHEGHAREWRTRAKSIHMEGAQRFYERVRLLVVGDRDRADNRAYYPLHPQRTSQIGERFWSDAPKKALGPHDGLPDKQRISKL